MNMETLIPSISEEMTPSEPETVRTVLSREMLSIEQRHFSRRNFRTTITVFLSDEGSFAEPAGPLLTFNAMSCNISQGGMCFRCPQHLTVPRLVLRFRLPEQVYTLVEAEVIHSRQEDDGCWTYGVAFRTLLPEDWPFVANHAARDDVPSASST